MINILFGTHLASLPTLNIEISLYYVVVINIKIHVITYVLFSLNMLSYNINYKQNSINSIKLNVTTYFRITLKHLLNTLRIFVFGRLRKVK